MRPFYRYFQLFRGIYSRLYYIDDGRAWNRNKLCFFKKKKTQERKGKNSIGSNENISQYAPHHKKTKKKE